MVSLKSAATLDRHKNMLAEFRVQATSVYLDHTPARVESQREMSAPARVGSRTTMGRRRENAAEIGRSAIVPACTAADAVANCLHAAVGEANGTLVASTLHNQQSRKRRVGLSPDYSWPEWFGAKRVTPARSASEGKLLCFPRLLRASVAP